MQITFIKNVCFVQGVLADDMFPVTMYKFRNVNIDFILGAPNVKTKTKY